jgi:uncharacterized membrane protein
MSENSNSIGLNELVDYQKKTYSPMMDRIMRFLWKCGGADPQILQYAPYSDHIKNAGIGGVVLATTVMAMIAMGFAMHTIFGDNDAQGHHGNWAITIPVSLVWGLIIFNLDRFIVSTVKGDGTEKITLGEWGAMLPRLVMAIIIGLTISAPLETYIFQKEIQREWQLSMDKLALAKKYEIQQEEDQKNAENVKNYDLKKQEVDAQREIVKEWENRFSDETMGRSGPRGYGKEAIKMEENMKIEKNRLAQLEAQLKEFEDKKVGNEDLVKAKQDSSMAKIKREVPGFLDKIMMLEKLSAHGKEVEKYNAVTGKVEEKQDPDDKTKTIAKKEEIYGSAFWPIWLVRLLFMIVEIAPVIFKFMIWKSSYDYMQDNVSQILEAKQGISLEIITDENNKMHKVKENYNARRIVEVSKRQNELEKENAIHAITLYAEKEREEIEKNPEKFVKQDPESSSENA